MAYYEIWAPKARQMEVQMNGRREPMQPVGNRGWWRCAVAEGDTGADYGFWIDGEGPFPDPRSPWQPSGVHGLSRPVDHSAFRWSDQHFQARPLAAAVFYELHIGAFTTEGTFDSAADKLDYLAGLGITHIELMPVNAFPGARGWGYDGVDLFAPQQSYGGPEGLKRFVDAAHTRGLAVILDVVYNHLGPDGNYLDKFGPYHSETYQTGWGSAMNLDGAGSDEVRAFFIENARMWLREYHMDGLRLDAVHALVDRSAVHFLEELGYAVQRLEIETGRHLVLIAESELNDPRMVRPPEQGGYGLHAQWSDDFHHALHVLLTGERSGYYVDYNDWADLFKALVDVFVMDGCYSTLRKRRHGRPVGALPGHRFLGYIQNHDQIGNRARGERISQLVGPEAAKVAAAIVFASAFVPMLFMGEEWGSASPFQYFTDHGEALGKMVSEGRRNEFSGFGWKPEDVPDPQDPETFQRSGLDWDALEREPHAALLAWHRKLISLHRKGSGLVDGRLQPEDVHYDPVNRWLVIHRAELMVVCSLLDREQVVPVDTRHGHAVAASAEGARLTPEGVLLPPNSVLIFQLGET